jgi:uncharacterized membrane protein (UPF0127 family)
MIFIAGDGRIHRIEPNVQPGNLHTISSNGPVRFVLEINAGVAARAAILEGDRVGGLPEDRNRFLQN